MKFLFSLAFLFFSGVTHVSAAAVFQTVVTEPYELIPLATDLEQVQIHIGTLENFPIMYEFLVSATTTLAVQLSQQYKGNALPTDFALMIVREDDKGGGVSEIARLHPEAADWQIRKEAALGMKFWDSALISNELRPGVYRIEVSTPLNDGRYMLTLGTANESLGYFRMLQHAREIQSGFGLSIFSMLKSSLVYYPLGILLLLFAIYRTWKLRNNITHVA
ncbi:MAG: hypothetical protein E6P95_02375 [Candidatus Moraniibacteriota bacterium]|jgi:hypothetical protein|nr:MAG: hypothetical protein E6P95_02375 [Candidatus Moranbacteria bacterium]